MRYGTLVLRLHAYGSLVLCSCRYVCTSTVPMWIWYPSAAETIHQYCAYAVWYRGAAPMQIWYPSAVPTHTWYISAMPFVVWRLDADVMAAPV